MKKDKRNKEVETENIETETVEVNKDKKIKNIFKLKNKTVVPSEKKGAEKFTVKGKLNVNKKQVACICGGVVAVLVLVFGILLFVNKDNSEKVMTGKLNDLGTEFYETFYYKSAGGSDDTARSEFLGRFKDIGIKVSLENLVRYYVTTDDYKKIEGALVDATVSERVEDLLKVWFKTDKYTCNSDNTKVVIYPKSPFGEKDYTLEIITDCGFESEQKEEK